MTDSPLISCLMATREHLVPSCFTIDHYPRQTCRPGEHCYVIHDGNSWDETHLESAFSRATRRFENDADEIMQSQLAETLPIHDDEHARTLA